MSKFSEAIRMFDAGPGNPRVLPTSLVPVDGKIIANPKIKNERDQNLEEYYKWQFIYALIYSGLYAKDYIGTEIRFPKGNKMSAPLRLDAAIFDDASWLSQDGSNGEPYVNSLPGHTELYLVIPIREWNETEAVPSIGAKRR